VDQSYGYDALGNLTSKAGVSYSYGPQAPYNGGPHAALSGAWSGAGSAGYGYDAAGNLTGGPGRSLTWYADNTLQTVSSGGGTEQ
jgi:uncharacterized protein RhaS with RHS repeats